MWCRERCGKCGKEWSWEFHEGMKLGERWPCGCLTKGASTLVMWETPEGCIRVEDDILVEVKVNEGGE
jgi:hypothetical protein